MTIDLVSRVSIKGSYSITRDAGEANIAIDESSVSDISNGTGAGQANAIYIDDFSIPASNFVIYDLSGSLQDVFGNFVIFSSVKEILVTASPANTNNIIYGNDEFGFVGPLGGPSQTVTIKPGGRFSVTDGYSAGGWAVVNGSADRILLTNSGAGSAVAGTIVVIGEV